jgi:hypothetical protein
MWVLRYGAVLLSALRLAKQKRCRLISWPTGGDRERAQ